MSIQQDVFKQIMQSLPDTFLERATALRTRDVMTVFDKGDFVNDVYTWCLTNRIEISVQSAAQIAAYLLQTEQGAFRLYDYSQLALAFKARRARERYSALPVSHLEYAMRFEARTRNRILEWDLEQLSFNGGRPVSRLTLTQHFEPERKAMIDQALEEASAGMPYALDTSGPENLDSSLTTTLDPQSTLEEVDRDARRLLEATRSLSRSFPALTRIASQIIELCGELVVMIEREKTDHHL